MAIRKEWTEWHLTPRGWEQGSTRREGRGNDWRDEPADRLLSYQHIEIHGSAGQPATSQPQSSTSPPKISTPKISTEETWRTKDPAALKQLETALAKYGAAPSRLD
jgi:hypothetical protein